MGEFGELSTGRLRLARERSALFVKDLAARCAVSPQTVALWEKGLQRPTEDALERLAKVTGFPVSFFFRDEPDSLNEEAVAFRARTRIGARDKRAALAAAVLAREFATWIDARFQLPDVRLSEDDLSKKAADFVADLVRVEWGLGHKPIPSMIQLLESRGVLVLSLAQDVRELDAFSFWSGARPIVLLNTMKTVERSRFDAAHELYHLLCRHEKTTQREEDAANAFAGALLMPREDVCLHVRRGSVLGLEQLVQMKRRWGVSLPALVVRLRDLDLISEWQHRSHFIEMSKLGLRTAERNAIPERERSVVLAKVFDHLERVKGMRPADVAAELHLAPRQLQEFILGLGATLLPVGGGKTGSKPRPARSEKPTHLKLVGTK